MFCPALAALPSKSTASGTKMRVARLAILLHDVGVVDKDAIAGHERAQLLKQQRALVKLHRPVPAQLRRRRRVRRRLAGNVRNHIPNQLRRNALGQLATTPA